ncbi:MAG: hypothetical protein COA43_03615 [Robiginitomaculum sp.]|nr:MAG: hypothetical protein COA43_03615 [Robiginitomaculum sp.]
MKFTHCIATLDDASAIKTLMALSMAKLLPDVLSKEQAEKSEASMGATPSKSPQFSCGKR